MENQPTSDTENETTSDLENPPTSEPTSMTAIFVWIFIILAVIAGIGKILDLPKYGENSEYAQAVKRNKELQAEANQTLKRVVEDMMTNKPALTNTSTKKTDDKSSEKEGNQAYKIGYKQGCIRNGLEVKNTAQVDVLADSAADLVHHPKNKFWWTRRWRQGFIAAYNKCHADNPIKTMTGEVATQ